MRADSSDSPIRTNHFGGGAVDRATRSTEEDQANAVSAHGSRVRSVSPWWFLPRRWCPAPASRRPHRRRANGSPRRRKPRRWARRSSPTPAAAPSTASASRSTAKFICTGSCLSVWHPLVVPGTHADRPGQAGHGQAPRRPHPGHLQGPAALQLQRRHEDGRSQRRGNQGRRHLARREHLRRLRLSNLPHRTDLSDLPAYDSTDDPTARIADAARASERRKSVPLPVLSSRSIRRRWQAARGAGGRGRRTGHAALGDPAERRLQPPRPEPLAEQVADGQRGKWPVGAEVGAQQHRRLGASKRSASSLRSKPGGTWTTASRLAGRRQRRARPLQRAVLERQRRGGRPGRVRRWPRPAGGRRAAPPAPAPRLRRPGSAAAPARR